MRPWLYITVMGTCFFQILFAFKNMIISPSQQGKFSLRKSNLRKNGWVCKLQSPLQQSQYYGNIFSLLNGKYIPCILFFKTFSTLWDTISGLFYNLSQLANHHRVSFLSYRLLQLQIHLFHIVNGLYPFGHAIRCDGPAEKNSIRL